MSKHVFPLCMTVVALCTTGRKLRNTGSTRAGTCVALHVAQKPNVQNTAVMQPKALKVYCPADVSVCEIASQRSHPRNAFCTSSEFRWSSSHHEAQSTLDARRKPKTNRTWCCKYKCPHCTQETIEFVCSRPVWIGPEAIWALISKCAVTDWHKMISAHPGYTTRTGQCLFWDWAPNAWEKAVQTWFSEVENFEYGVGGENIPNYIQVGSR